MPGNMVAATELPRTGSVRSGATWTKIGSTDVALHDLKVVANEEASPMKDKTRKCRACLCGTLVVFFNGG